MNLKLGRSAKSMHRAPLKFSSYLLPVLPPLKPSTDWAAKVTVPWGMDGNDSLGDCTCAAMAHLVMAVTANSGGIVVPTLQEVETMYQASGWNPLDPNTDNGWTLDAANGYIVSTGLAGVKADGYVEVDNTNLMHCYYAIQLLGGINFGVNLPQSAMDTFGKTNGVGVVWDYDPNADNTILGGHSIEGVDFEADGSIRIVTWGSDRVLATPKWLAQFADEACAAYFSRFTVADGLNVAQMAADAKALAVAA
jgi:hypothetical protein